ncbi:MAG: Crp/Fnr family transcriptional regulator [Pseudomonadota bacterium]
MNQSFSASERQLALEKYLRRLVVRSDLTAEECRAISTLPADFADIGPQRDLVTPGEEMRHACLVVDGLAARFDQLANGQRQFTALHIPGDMCDLHSVPAPVAGWGIQALTRTRYLKVPHHALRRLIDDHPAIALAFWRDTIVDASILSKWISALGRRSAEARLAHLLCEVAIRLEQSGEGSRATFGLRATQIHLADFLGISTVHVSRSLQSLRARGLVEVHEYAYRIPDFPALARFAEFDPTYLLLSEPSVHDLS